jgi:hypothetical protein
VFEDVGDAGRVGGHGIEGDGEGLVAVVVLDRQQGAAEYLVVEEVDVGMEFVDEEVLLQGEARIGAAWCEGEVDPRRSARLRGIEAKIVSPSR